LAKSVSTPKAEAHRIKTRAFNFAHWCVPMSKKIPVVSLDPRRDVTLPRRMLTIPEAAIYIAATNSFVEIAGRTGELPSRFVGQRRVFDVKDLDKWIDAQPFDIPLERTEMQVCRG
jgi:hypothetical protein